MKLLLVRFSLIVFFIVTTIYSTFGQSRYSISILTCGAGNDLYTTFGQTAMRIVDNHKNTDLVFNYGTFDPTEDNFISGFISGKLKYFVSIEQTADFLNQYKIENRSIEEQLLDISDSESDILVLKIARSTVGAAKFYQYDFFRDNCTTKVRDFIVDYVDDSTKADLHKSSPSYRTVLNAFLLNENKYWINLGLDLLLGMEIDKSISQEAHLYMPVQLQLGQNKFQNRHRQNLILKESSIFQPIQEKTREVNYPMLVFSIMCVKFCILLTIRKRVNIDTLINWYSSLVLFITGFIGIVIFSLWLIYQRDIYINNLNVFWALPTNIILAFSVISPSFIAKCLHRISLAIEILFLCLIPFLPQKTNIALLPIIILLVLIHLLNSRPLKRQF